MTEEHTSSSNGPELEVDDDHRRPRYTAGHLALVARAQAHARLVAAQLAGRSTAVTSPTARALEEKMEATAKRIEADPMVLAHRHMATVHQLAGQATQHRSRYLAATAGVPELDPAAVAAQIRREAQVAWVHPDAARPLLRFD